MQEDDSKNRAGQTDDKTKPAGPATPANAVGGGAATAGQPYDQVGGAVLGQAPGQGNTGTGAPPAEKRAPDPQDRRDGSA